MITRFAVLPDERRVMLGLDKANVFDAGFVYEAFEMLDEIIIRKIGPYALPKDSSQGGRTSELSEIGQQLQSGMMFLTQKEYQELFL